MLFLGIAKVQCVDSQIVFSWTMAKLQISTYNKTTSAAKFNALYFITKIKRYFVNEEISKIDRSNFYQNSVLYLNLHDFFLLQ